MINRIFVRLVATMLVTLALPSVARADVWVPVGDGRYLVVPEGFVVLVLVAAAGFAGFYWLSQVFETSPTPPPPSPEDYDQESARLSAPLWRCA